MRIGRRRRGLALLIVLLLVAMTLGLSYATMRSQVTAEKIHQNCGRRTSARQAALTGLTMAIKKMQTSAWSGVGTSLSGSLGSDERFEVTYTAGDPSLSSDDPDYAELPYRVTLLSTGYAADPDTPQSIATHRIRAVVRLVPRYLGQQPTDWATMQQYTVYQSKKESFAVDIPWRVEGAVRVQDKLELAKNYPDDEDACNRYLRDLNQMRLAGQPDYRPFTGPVHLPYNKQDGRCLVTLAQRLDARPLDTPAQEAAADWTNPTSLTGYQIYAGGPVYPIPAVGGTLQNITLGPDPLTNPLGVYYTNAAVGLGDNVTIRGSLFCRNDLWIQGTNVHFEPVDLPALYGSEDPVRLPVASCDNFVVKPTADASVAGLVAAFRAFRVDRSPETVRFAITGRLITRKLAIRERQPWETVDWATQYQDFEDQLDSEQGPIIRYFPVWMKLQGRDPTPRLTIQPDPISVTYDWHNWYDPVYEPHPDDDGLRWELLEWTENP